MSPPLWYPPNDLSAAEQAIVVGIPRAKLFIFLRRMPQELFRDAFQAELAGIVGDRLKGRLPVPPRLQPILEP